MRVVTELSYVEVAQRLGISEGAARVRVSRGLAALAGLLEQVRPGAVTPWILEQRDRPDDPLDAYMEEFGRLLDDTGPRLRRAVAVD